jgi:NAD(P)H-dependent FMN reductase
MEKVSIISSSIRPERKSHRVALYLEKFLLDNDKAYAEIIDLREYDFPLFENKLSLQKNPAPNSIGFAEKIKGSDAVIIVTPEYNGGIPASLKNALDLLYDEWKHKPVGIVTASSGAFAGSQVLVALQFSLWKMKAHTISEFFSVPKVQDAYNNNGIPSDKAESDKKATIFVNELMNTIDKVKANKNMLVSM